MSCWAGSRPSPLGPEASTELVDPGNPTRLPQRAPGPFRKLDATAVLTGPLFQHPFQVAVRELVNRP